MYACGLRISEAASLEVTTIDGLNGLIRVVGKGNKERCVSHLAASSSGNPNCAHHLAVPAATWWVPR